MGKPPSRFKRFAGNYFPSLYPSSFATAINGLQHLCPIVFALKFSERVAENPA